MSSEQRARVDAILRWSRISGESAGDRSIEASRARFAAMMAQMIVPETIRIRKTMLGSRPALQVDADAVGEGVGTILYFHGGGWVAGSPETALSITGALVTRTGFRSYSVDYRLAPEHQFPAAIDDALSAYRVLLDDGHDPAGMAFVGDSAGGGLTVTTCLAARDQGLPLPAAIVAFSPAFDATGSGDSMDTRAGLDPIFTREYLQSIAAMYLGGEDPRQVLASPALLADLTGFPPMLLQVGGNEVLLDDSTRMAGRAAHADVSVTLDITADVPHVFQSFAGVLDEADEALERAAQFLTRHLRATGPVSPPST
ncbi:alpha/beta hydrolase [Nonomuraea lactucae]|uniref:alpha/beta hydrolase n=1 Tax=Nonomuraea lactucae TaxID=2249762 RepID=UPI000DE3AE4A|nr:alpha/beta hydrolase [Nonomuraea lactucae]